MGRISPGPTRWPPGAERRLVPAKSNLKPQTSDCVILAVDRHSGYILAVPGKKSKKKDKKDKHGVGLQAKTVANAMIRHWLTIFDVPAVI